MKKHAFIFLLPGLGKNFVKHRNLEGRPPIGSLELLLAGLTGNKKILYSFTNNVIVKNSFVHTRFSGKEACSPIHPPIILPSIHPSANPIHLSMLPQEHGTTITEEAHNGNNLSIIYYSELYGWKKLAVFNLSSYGWSFTNIKNLKTTLDDEKRQKTHGA